MKKMIKMKKMKKMMKVFAVILAVCLLAAGCSSTKKANEPESGGMSGYESNESGNVEEEYYMGDEAAADEDQGVALASQADGDEAEAGSGQAKQSGEKDSQEKTTEAAAGKEKATKEEKLVYTCEMTIESTSYKETLAEIEKQIKAFSGIIESQNEDDTDYGWFRDGHEKTSGTMQTTIVVRIPSKDYQAFLQSLDGKGKMTHKSMEVTNISRTYYDTQATIESLKIQEKRLLKMMDEANTIEDMIKVEKRLTEVQTDLNRYRTQLDVMDTQVAYSTVTIKLQEVIEYKKDVTGRKTNTFLERLINTIIDSWTGFLGFMEGLVFLAIRLLPFALVFGLVWYASRPLRKKFRAHREKKKAVKKQARFGQKEIMKQKTDLPENRKDPEEKEEAPAPKS